MQFQKFRLAGFKSFVEPAEVEIAAGLTGIVGPNGCGKSNLVEGLRWVMGETSARRLRGGEMDDVIFGGAVGRPARNIAEVTLVIDNAARTAPAVFNAFDEIEVRRRIERGAGSDFRVNGKSVRARDVQLLFADAAIGADSPALVSQGRVAALIAAKPAERRYVLEDAAGIGGMQARRHEAEMKLQAAETNLRQIDTVLEALNGQATGLQRQARQAEKYRSLAEQIRAAEALLLYVIWREAAARHERAQHEFRQTETEVATALAANAAATLRESEAELGLPALRTAREQAHSRLRDLTQQQAALTAERQQHERDLQNAVAEQAEAARDQQAEQASQAGAAGRLQALWGEAAQLKEQAETVTNEILAAREALTIRTAAAANAEEVALQQAAELAGDRAQAAALARQESEARARQEQAQTTLNRIQGELTALAGHEPTLIVELERRVETAQQEVQRWQAKGEAMRQTQLAAREDETAARQAANQAEAALLRHQAELSGLERSLASGAAPQDFPPVLDRLRVTPGYEAALAAALAGDLAAALETAAPHRWRELNSLPPVSGESLGHHVEAPAALRRALQFVEIVEPDAALARQAELQPGQLLVTRAGALYRWDGLVRETAATSSEAIRLTQCNELVRLNSDLPALSAASEQAASHADTARQKMQAAAAAEQELFAQLSAFIARQHSSEQALAAAKVASQAAAAQQARLEEALQTATETLAASDAAMQQVQTDRQDQPDLAAAETALAAAQSRRQQSREAADQASRTLRQAELAEEARLARLVAIDRERQSWQEILDRGDRHLRTMAARQAAAAAREAEVRARLPEIDAALSALLEQLAAAERQERQAGDALVVAEQALAGLRQAARAAAQILSEAREQRGGAEARLVAARESVAEAAHQLHERCHLAPDVVTLSLSPAEEAATRESAEHSLARLLREREALGAVNLRAESELAEIKAEVQRIGLEKTDLLLAIERLRQAIGTLNREARDRLLAAFETVQVQFQRLFTTLFGGGEAELTLTGLDDPLSAGLEIYASPPGKKLQLLSLLSGGEQALTALALLFAMFLATPAPVCVLDEVDAPLDDANVTRFCNLLDEISATTGTRFLVITHHRVTMARMDRLYGVTMAERGVSQLVSVDLKVAEGMGKRV